MLQVRRFFLNVLVALTATLSVGMMSAAHAASAEDLNKDSMQALHHLTSTNPLAADLAKKA